MSSWTTPVPAFGPLPDRPGFAAREVTGRRIASLIARAGREADLAAALGQQVGITLPTGPRRVAAGGTAVLGTGPGKWLLVQEPSAPDLAPAFAGLAALVDQGGAYAVLALSGSAAERALTRAVPLDLAPAAFPAGSVATTIIEHVGVTIARLAADPPAFELYVARSFARSLGHWVMTAPA